MVTLTDQVLIELCPAVERAHRWLDVSCREHPDVPRGKPRATARVDLIPGLAVFFSARWKKWTSTAVIFNPQTSENIVTKNVSREIEDEPLELVWIHDTLANICNALAHNEPSVAPELLAHSRQQTCD